MNSDVDKRSWGHTGNMADISSKDARRAQLLGVALELFGEKGYHATTISDIIARAKVARGTFYNYFDSKRQIFATVLDQLFDAVTSSVYPIELHSELSVQDQVHDNIARVCVSLRDNTSMARILFEQAVGLDEEANQQLQDFYNRVLKRLERAIGKGQGFGIVRGGDAGILATCLLGMIKESLYQQVLGTRDPDPQALATEIFNIAARGILVGMG
ncbi:MAG: TetR/AcrR family transcriptional regulator [Myxococcota bacterium]